jgi:hypothetical protein
VIQIQSIFQLQNEGQIIEGDDAPRKHITSYYKNLFGPPSRNMVSMDESRIDDIPQVSEVENESLIKKITEKEVKEAIFQMEYNKAKSQGWYHTWSMMVCLFCNMLMTQFSL